MEYGVWSMYAQWPAFDRTRTRSPRTGEIEIGDTQELLPPTSGGWGVEAAGQARPGQEARVQL